MTDVDGRTEATEVLLTLLDVSAATGTSVETLRDHIRRGFLGVRREASGRYLVTLTEFERYCRERPGNFGRPSY